LFVSQKYIFLKQYAFLRAVSGGVGVRWFIKNNLFFTIELFPSLNTPTILFCQYELMCEV